MANPLKQLAGDTAIYGLSTILARVVNFMLLPLYTRVLHQAQYGVVTEFMAYIAVLQVVLTMGLETGSFRYASKEGTDRNTVFSSAFVSVAALCAIVLCAVLPFSGRIAGSLGYEGFANIIIYVGLILAIDCSTAIIFAKLRYEHKAFRFAIIRTVKILSEVGANLLLYLVMPARFAANPDHWMLAFVSPEPDFTYAIFAIFISCLVALVLLLPDLFRMGLKVDVPMWKKMMLFSLPIMVAGLPGILNDFLDRILMRHLAGAQWRADLGVYQAGVKIAVLISLFTQMFRYAAEPFFFQRQKEKDNIETNVKVMNWFVAFCMLGFVFIMLFFEQIGLILGKDFRVGLDITPIMLMAYVLVGVLFNVNMWYKLAEKPQYAVWITLAGLAVSVIIDVAFMPQYSYHAAAWGHLASYLAMVVFTALLGRKHYYIPYNWGLVCLFIAAGLGIWWLGTLLPQMSAITDIAVRFLLLLGYVAVAGLALKYYPEVSRAKSLHRHINS